MAAIQRNAGTLRHFKCETADAVTLVALGQCTKLEDLSIRDFAFSGVGSTAAEQSVASTALESLKPALRNLNSLYLPKKWEGPVHSLLTAQMPHLTALSVGNIRDASVFGNPSFATLKTLLINMTFRSSWNAQQLALFSAAIPGLVSLQALFLGPETAFGAPSNLRAARPDISAWRFPLSPRSPAPTRCTCFLR